MRMGNSSRAAGRSRQPQHYAVEGFLCTFFKFASLGVCDILHDVQALGAALVQALQPMQL